MSKIGLMWVMLMFFGFELVGQPDPVVKTIELVPPLSITHFDDYVVKADIDSTGISIQNVTLTATPNNTNSGGSAVGWNYFAGGTPGENTPINHEMKIDITKFWYSYKTVSGSNRPIRPDDIYPEILFVPSSYAYTNAPEELRINQNNFPIFQFSNPFTMGASTGFYIEFNTRPQSLSGPPSVDLEVYLIDKRVTSETYEDFFSGNWRSSAFTALVATINRDDAVSHTHTINSSHHLVALQTNSSGNIVVGTKTLDVSERFWVVLYAPTQLTTRDWLLRYHDDYTPPASTNWYIRTSGTITRQATSAPDMHVHLARSVFGSPRDGLSMKVDVEYTHNSISKTATSTETVYFNQTPQLPPNASSFTAPAAGTYSGNVTISWNPATDPNNDLLSYSIYLYDDEQEVDVYSIAENLTSILSYDFNTTLAPDGGYNIRIKVCDPLNACVSFFLYDTYLQGEEFVIANNPKTWTGAISAEWDNKDNWNPSGAPLGTEVLVFPEVINDLVINSIKSAKRITIEPGGKVTIGPTGALTLTDALVNKAGASGLVIEYGGSLIHKAAWPELGVPATVGRTIAAGGWSAKTTKDGWHLLSSPIHNQLIESGFTATQAVEYDFYGWEEATDTWVNQKGANWNTWNGDTFIPGRGYLVSYKNGLNGEFLGNLNLEDVTASGLTFSGNPTSDLYEKGWHLLGSPYASGLDWGSASWVKTNIGTTAKIWGEGGYVDVQVDLNNTIPAMQGFFVQVTEAPGSITIPAAARIHGGIWNKTNETPHFLLSTSAVGSSLRQRAVIREHPGIEGDFNAAFLPGNAPQLFAVSANRKLSTWASDRITPGLVIDLGFIKNNEGNYFDISLMQSIPGINLWLYDKQLDYEHALDVNNAYSFVSEEGDDPLRFEIRFSSVNDATNTVNRNLHEDSKVYVTGNMMHVQFGTSQSGRLEIYDLSGRLMLQQTMGEILEYVQPLNLQSGVYLVRVTGKGFSKTEKVIVE